VTAENGFRISSILQMGAICIAVLSVVGLASIAVNAGELSGKFISAWQFSSLDSMDHVRPYQSLYTDLKLTTQFSIHSSARWSTDFADQYDNDPQLYVYDLYGKLRLSKKGATIKFGRQFGHSPVGSGQFDGLSLSMKPFAKLQATLFGGAEVSRLDPEEVQSLSDQAIAGTRIDYRFSKHVTAGINSFARWENEDLSAGRIGLDLSFSKSDWRTYWRAAYDLAVHELSDIKARATYSKRGWLVSAEYYQRRPMVLATSIFSMIETDGYRRLRGELSRDVTRSVALFAHLAHTIYTDESTTRTTIGVRQTLGSLAWEHQSGYGGERDALRATLALPLNEKVQLYASSGLSQYKVQSMQEDRSDAYSVSAGLTARVAGSWRGRLEAQYLRNALQSSTGRLYLSISKGFKFSWQ
jgi:hypothetical protein